MSAFEAPLLRQGAKLLNRFGPSRRWLNRLLIDRLVTKCRERPHPWSTAHDYVSWTSLTERRWSARHLPAYDPDQPLPPVEEVVELFRRPDGVPSRLSSKSTLLFPAFAQYLTDGFIRTRMPSDDEDPSIRLQNTSNHEIDLCTLYGRTPAQTLALRTRSEDEGERGRLRSEVQGGEEFPPLLLDGGGAVRPEFAVLDEPLGASSMTDEGRRTLFAVGGDRVNAVPQVAMINTLLLREHNRLAAAIEADHPDWDDTRVFETARNCVIVMFITIVVEEYINHISPVDSPFTADPSAAWDAPWNKPNWITTEFSLLYRWHSLIPDETVWNGTTLPARATLSNNAPLVAGGLRQSFIDISSQAAARLGPRNTTPTLLPIEAAAIAQGRLARLAPVNDYRRYMGMDPFVSFDEVSSDAGVASQLRDLYGRVGRIEYYPGLFAEDPVGDGPLPELLLYMVAVDAFSQALTNPLLSKHVFTQGPAVFSEVGWRTIGETHTLRDVLARNVSQRLGRERISMDRSSWRP
ncbi:MAG: peroxidase family protein [Actinomycetota bacterium]